MGGRARRGPRRRKPGEAALPAGRRPADPGPCLAGRELAANPAEIAVLISCRRDADCSSAVSTRSTTARVVSGGSSGALESPPRVASTPAAAPPTAATRTAAAIRRRRRPGARETVCAARVAGAASDASVPPNAPANAAAVG